MTALVEQFSRLSDSLWLPRALAAGLALLCAWWSARLLWLLLAGPGLTTQGEPGFALGEPLPRAARPSIVPWHLFGTTAQAGPGREAAPASALALVLRGTLASAEAGRGLAFIADAQGRERAFRVGEAVAEGAVLVEVHAEHVILSRGGAREALHLGRAEGGAPAPARMPSAPATADPSGGFIAGTMSFGAPDLATARAAQAPGLAELAATANLLPATENGRFVGVRIAVADPALLERFGVHPDDVVTAVNDVALSDPTQRRALEDSLRGEGPLVLTLRREGRERRLTVRN